jgi:hypothetical protein
MPGKPPINVDTSSGYEEEHLMEDFRSAKDFLNFLGAPSATDQEVYGIKFSSEPEGQDRKQEFLQKVNEISGAVQRDRTRFFSIGRLRS